MRSLILALLLTTSLFADGPADNVPDKVRPIPPEGIQVPDDKKKALLDQAAEIDKQLMAVASQTHATDRARVSVITRAVRMTVEDGMFYSDKEVDQAATLLKIAESKLGELKSGLTGAGLLIGAPVADDKPRAVASGFISKIDGSVQPFGLVLPPQKQRSGKPMRLDVWLHGRGEKVSEVAFLHQRMNSVGDVAPENTIVLHPYGRYCNAFKFAGEIDVLEAIEHVKRTFVIDEDRISIRGFSMGGAGCWQMAVHYPVCGWQPLPVRASAKLDSS